MDLSTRKDNCSKNIHRNSIFCINMKRNRNTVVNVKMICWQITKCVHIVSGSLNVENINKLHFLDIVGIETLLKLAK